MVVEGTDVRGRVVINEKNVLSVFCATPAPVTVMSTDVSVVGSLPVVTNVNTAAVASLTGTAMPSPLPAGVVVGVCTGLCPSIKV